MEQKRLMESKLEDRESKLIWSMTSSSTLYCRNNRLVHYTAAYLLKLVENLFQIAIAIIESDTTCRSLSNNSRNKENQIVIDF